MQQATGSLIDNYLKQNRQRRAFRKFVQMLCCVVVFVTTYLLILPAITMEKQTHCGLKEHTHTDSCLQMSQHLICSLQEGTGHYHQEACYLTEPGHTHGESCYEPQLGELNCSEEESEDHRHDENCYQLDLQLICDTEETSEVQMLICTEAVQDAHTHEDTCYEMRFCTADENHGHSASCYTCGSKEHTHNVSCYSDPEADLEKESDWESVFEKLEFGEDLRANLLAVAQSQMDYRESDRNYQVSEDDTIHGYTRYGQWHGAPYDAWNEIFVAFCLHYAEIPEEALCWSDDAAKWAEQLSEKELLIAKDIHTPIPGDLIYMTNEEQEICSVGIVQELGLEVDPESSDDPESQIPQVTLILGDVENHVSLVKIPLDDESIYGYCSLEPALALYEAEQEKLMAADSSDETPGEITLVVETENYIVRVTYSTEVVLPEGTELRVTEYARDSEIFRQRCLEAGYELEWLLNIGFFMDDEELDLKGKFDVVVTS